MDDTPLFRPAAPEAILTNARRLHFTLSCEKRTGSLLATLTASKPGGRLPELGTGVGAGAARIAAGMDAIATLVTAEQDLTVGVALVDGLPGRAPAAAAAVWAGVRPAVDVVLAALDVAATVYVMRGCFTRRHPRAYAAGVGARGVHRLPYRRGPIGSGARGIRPARRTGTRSAPGRARAPPPACGGQCAPGRFRQRATFGHSRPDVSSKPTRVRTVGDPRYIAPHRTTSHDELPCGSNRYGRAAHRGVSTGMPGS
ncbi:hypothetical protein GCM10027168_41990 [Streptomyces capparidis]